MPGCALASDQPYRETDLAIDYCEDVPPLPLDAAERIAALMRAAGLTAKISSIHVNGWFGDYDKLAMTGALFAERFGVDLDARTRASSCSPATRRTTRRCSRFFEHSVGVANVRASTAWLAPAPKYVTARRRRRRLRRARARTCCGARG